MRKMEYPLWFQVRRVKAGKGNISERYQDYYIETERTDNPRVMALKIVSELDVINRDYPGVLPVEKKLNISEYDMKNKRIQRSGIKGHVVLNIKNIFEVTWKLGSYFRQT